MIGQFIQRKQTGEYTCGAAALTLAIAEISASPNWNTDQQEQIIWRQVRGGDQTWSVPGKLALYAWKGGPGIQARIWQDDQRLELARRSIPPALVTFDIGSRIREHNRELERSEQNGVQVMRSAHDVNTLTDLMDSGWRLLVVTVVALTAGLGLHYLLGRKKSDVYGYALMDPEEGRNAPYFGQDLNAYLFEPAPDLSGLPRYLGITVGLWDFRRGGRAAGA
jgi:hypothetical protein